MRFASTTGVLLGLATASLLAGCPAFPGAVCDNGACDNLDGAAGDGIANDGASGSDGANDGGVSQDGGDGGGSDGPSDALTDNWDGFDGFICPTTAAPKDQACVIDESLGVFVSPTGNDSTGAGTKAMPYATIAKAMTSAKAASKRVYACAGTYTAALSVDAAVDGVKVYGGLKCTDWSYSGSKAIVAPTAAGYALVVSGLTTGITFEDFEFDAKDAVAAGESSIAVKIVSSSGVVLRRVTASAGTGRDGTTATQASQASSAPNGHAASGTTGGAQCSNTCADGNSIGGKGGDTTGAGSGDNGQPSLGGAPPNDGAGGAAFVLCSAGGTGNTGAAGTNGTASSAPTTVGALSSSAWTPSPGTTGSAATRAQGGGGGGARQGGGGSGACGGCGGAGGGGGGGGGASIAIVVFQSTATIESSALITKAGGNGGSGTAGQIGQAGGGGAAGAGTPAGCTGGDGAKGGNGGAGSGGAGGLSVGILYKGTLPTVDSTTQSSFTGGAAGTAGQGGQPGVNNGPIGIAQAVLAAP